MKVLVRTLALTALLFGTSAMAEEMGQRIAEQLQGVTGPMILCVLEGDTVTLFGNVEDRLEAQRVISEVEKIDGVENVVSRLITQ